MQSSSEIDKWAKVNILTSKKERIEKLLKTHKEYSGVSEFVDESITLRLDKLEGSN